MVNAEQFQSHYRDLPDDELEWIALNKAQHLQPEARQALQQEIEARSRLLSTRGKASACKARSLEILRLNEVTLGRRKGGCSPFRRVGLRVGVVANGSRQRHLSNISRPKWRGTNNGCQE
jgi:hypothetical protein